MARTIGSRRSASEGAPQQGVRAGIAAPAGAPDRPRPRGVGAGRRVVTPRPHERLLDALRGSGWRRTALLRRAAAGVLAHVHAGRRAAEPHGPDGVIASDVIAALPAALESRAP